MKMIKMETKISLPYSKIAKYLLYFLLLFTPLARGSVHYWQHTIIEMIALSILFVLLLEKGITGKPSFRKSALDKPIAATLILVTLAALFGVSVADSGEALALLLSYVSIFYATLSCIRTREDQRELVYIICGIGLLLSFIGILKIFGITLPFWVYDELNYPAWFMSGVYGNHNHLAGYLEMAIPLLLALFLMRTRGGLQWMAIFGTAVILISSHILTMSRGGWLALGASLTFLTAVLFFNKQYKKKKLLVLFISTLVIIAFCTLSGANLFERALSLADGETVLGLNGRMLIWKGVVELIKDSPFLGIGPGTFAIIFPQFQLPGSTVRFYQAHNDYLHFLAELGVLFVPLFFWLLIALFRTGREKLNSSSRQTWSVTLGAMTGIVAILVHSLVDFNLHIPANALLFTVLSAIVVGGPRKVLRKQD